MKYKKKPVIVDVIKFDAEEWFHKRKEAYPMVETLETVIRSTEHGTYFRCQAIIRTLESHIILSDGDYIIKGVQGEFYSCKPDVFEATYELAE